MHVCYLYLLMRLFIYMYQPIHLFVCLSIRLFIYLSIHIFFTYIAIYYLLCVSLYICQSVLIAHLYGLLLILHVCLLAVFFSHGMHSVTSFLCLSSKTCVL